jgi:hypothetical protein
MEWAALITWVLTAGGGFVLLAVWLRHGGMAQAGRARRIRPATVLTHFGLAATGLVLWIVYVAVDRRALAWIAFGLLAAVALLGFAMFGTWLGQRRGLASTEANPPAERRFPVPVVGLHGVLAATTLVLVLLTAAGVSS